MDAVPCLEKKEGVPRIEARKRIVKQLKDLHVDEDEAIRFALYLTNCAKDEEKKSDGKTLPLGVKSRRLGSILEPLKDVKIPENLTATITAIEELRKIEL
eukprot:3690133-Amphidinium_carterae.2